MGPSHKFIVTDRVSITFEEFKKKSLWVRNNIMMENNGDEDIKGYFTIGDDLIAFMQGTLYWIPLKNFTKRDERYDGLCNYGRTKIEGESLKLFADLLKHWIAIFRCAPDEVCLTNNYQFYLKEWEHYGEYSYKTVDVVASLEKALEYTLFAIDNNYIIIHSGI